MDEYEFDLSGIDFRLEPAAEGYTGSIGEGESWPPIKFEAQYSAPVGGKLLRWRALPDGEWHVPQES